MNTKTATEHDSGDRDKPHDMCLRSMMDTFPQFTLEIIGLVFGVSMLSVLDLENAEFRLSKFISALKRVLRPDGVLVIPIKGSKESAPPLIVIVEHKSHIDPETMQKAGRYMNATSAAFPGSVVMLIVIYHGEKKWDFDTTYPESLKLFPEELSKYDDQSLHMKVFFLDLNDEDVMEAAMKLQFAPVFYILPNIWKKSEEVIVRVLTLLWEKFPEDNGLRDAVGEQIFDYITRFHPDLGKQQLIDIEARNFDEDKRIMSQALTFQEDYIEQGMQKGLQKGMREGVQKTKLEVAENMIRDGLDDSSVVKYSGLSSDDVSEVRRKLNGAGS